MAKRRSNLVLKGKFAGSLHPAKLLFGLLKAKKTGVLTLHEGTAHISVYLNSGCVVFDRGGVFADEDFGQFIIGRSLTTTPEYQQYKSTAKKKKMTPVDLMIQAGILDETETELLAQEYFWRAAPSFFLWRKGDYTFLENRKTSPSEYATLANGAVFILRGIMDKYDPVMMRGRLQKRLKNRLKINENNIITPRDLEEISVVADFLAVISEESTLSDIMDELGGDENHTIALAYGLLTLGLLKFSVSDEKKYERSLKRRTDPLSRLYSAAVKSVDQVHVRTNREGRGNIKSRKPAESQEFPEVKDAGDVLAALEKGENVEGALTQRLNKLMEVKRKKRELLQHRINQAGENGAAPLIPAGQAPEKKIERVSQPLSEEKTEVPEALTAESDPGVRLDAPVIHDTHIPSSIDPTPSDNEFFAQTEKPDLSMSDSGSDFIFQETKTESDLNIEKVKDAGASQVDAMEDNEGVVVFDFGDSDMGAEEFLESVEPDNKYDPNMYRPGESAEDDIAEAAFIPGESFEAVVTALREFCDQKKWKDADKAFAELQMREQVTADILAMGGWARYHLSGDDPFARGAMLIQKGIDMDPKLDIPYLYMGRLYMEEGDNAMAELYFIHALEVNKDCLEAKDFMKKLYEL
jgi:Domain of unknown function (DUF4388)